MKNYLIRYIENESGNIVDSNIRPIESSSHLNAIVRFINENPNTLYKEVHSEIIAISSNPIISFCKRLLFSQYNSKRIENNPLFNLNSVKEISLDDVKINEKEDAAESIESFCFYYPLINIWFIALGYFISENINPLYFVFDCFLVWTLSTQYYSFKTISIANLITLLYSVSLLISLLRISGLFHYNGVGSWVGSLIWLWASIKTNKQARIFNSFHQDKKVFSTRQSNKKLFGSVLLFSIISATVIYINAKKNPPNIESVSSTVSTKEINSGYLSTFEIDGITISVPAPNGFIEVSKRFPEAFRLRNLLPSVKLILLYFTKQDYERRATGNNSNNDIVADIKTMRGAENIKFDESSFKEVVDETKKYFADSLKDFNKSIQSEMADVDQYKTNNLKAEITSSKVLNDAKNRVVIATELNINGQYRYVLMSMILIKNKILNVYLTGRNNSQAELDELIRIESGWVPKILTENN